MQLQQIQLLSTSEEPLSMRSNLCIAQSQTSFVFTITLCVVQLYWTSLSLHDVDLLQVTAKLRGGHQCRHHTCHELLLISDTDPTPQARPDSHPC